jgi:hypothetical protein
MKVAAMMPTQAHFGSPRNATPGVMATSARQYSQQLPVNRANRVPVSIMTASVTSGIPHCTANSRIFIPIPVGRTAVADMAGA